MEHAIAQILEPVIESTQILSSEIRLNVLTLTVNNMMETWSNVILEQEIIFRCAVIRNVGSTCRCGDYTSLVSAWYFRPGG